MILTCTNVVTAIMFRWSAEFGVNSYGSPELHVMLAEYIYSESPEVVCFSNWLWVYVHCCFSWIYSLCTMVHVECFYKQLYEHVLFWIVGWKNRRISMLVSGQWTQFTSNMQDMARVTNHFVRGNNPKKFASIILNFMGKVSLISPFCFPFPLGLYSYSFFLVQIPIGHRKRFWP